MEQPHSLGSNMHQLDIAEQKELHIDEELMGIRVNKISKHFTKSSLFGMCKSQKSVTTTNKACDQISFEIGVGKLVTVLGQNGAGKTTLINMLTGYLKPTSGEAEIMGCKLSSQMNQIRQMTSLCPQFDICFEDLTIVEHLELFSIIKGFSDRATINREIKRTIEMVGLADKANEYVKHLSGGMKRRLSIAISSIGDPKVIFFDEPTTGLDPVTKEQVLQLIKSRLNTKI
jgi:ATP-binding cassette subfamily A (ABC1) protein 3